MTSVNFFLILTPPLPLSESTVQRSRNLPSFCQKLASSLPLSTDVICTLPLSLNVIRWQKFVSNIFIELNVVQFEHKLPRCIKTIEGCFFRAPL